MKEKATRICIAVLVGAVICTIGISAEDKPKPREKKVPYTLKSPEPMVPLRCNSSKIYFQ